MGTIVNMKLLYRVHSLRRKISNRITPTNGPVLCLVPGLVYLFMLLKFGSHEYMLKEGWTKLSIKEPVPPNLLTGTEKYSSINKQDGLTLVTAYFNLGTFQKGVYNKFGTQTYYGWMKNYAFVNNTVILFTDLSHLAARFKFTRRMFPPNMTKIFIVHKKDFWAFQIMPEIASVYNQTDYPKYYPNTVMPAYSSAMHVKYDLIELAIKKGLVKTKYLAWIDIGYFRRDEKAVFTMSPPSDIKDDHVAFTQIDPFIGALTPWEVIYENVVFLAGGMFLGRPEYLLLMVEDYRKAVIDMLEMKLMSTDQQILYYMYLPVTSFIPKVPIQRYYALNRNQWFYLGDLCRENSLKIGRRKEKFYSLNLLKYFGSWL